MNAIYYNIQEHFPMVLILFLIYPDALGSLVTVLSNLMLNSKENIDQSLVDSWNDEKTVNFIFY